MKIDPSEVLKRCHLFAGTTGEDRELLLSVARIRDVPRGELLFEEGQKADGFYVVAAGRIKVFKLAADGRERILHIIQPGSTFAEAAIFDDGNYPAFAMSLDVSTLLFFSKNQFLDLLNQRPRLAINMIAGLSKFLRVFAMQIEDLTFRDVPSRLARYLLSLQEGSATQVVLPVSKAQLASNLGTTSETLSRTLRKLADEEMIRVNGKIISILDPERLQDLVDIEKV